MNLVEENWKVRNSFLPFKHILPGPWVVHSLDVSTHLSVLLPPFYTSIFYVTAKPASLHFCKALLSFSSLYCASSLRCITAPLQAWIAQNCSGEPHHLPKFWWQFILGILGRGSQLSRDTTALLFEVPEPTGCNPVLPIGQHMSHPPA